VQGGSHIVGIGCKVDIIVSRFKELGKTIDSCLFWFFNIIDVQLHGLIRC